MAGVSNYDHHHRQLRRQLEPEAHGRPCHFCHQLMLPGQKLDLDHTVDRKSYRGIAHASCNRRDGGRRGAAATNRKRRKPADPGPSRQW
jgi:hypothetical protein